MLNIVKVNYTKFTIIDSNGYETEEKFGYTVVDEYEKAFDIVEGDFEALMTHVNEKTILNLLERNWDKDDGFIYAVHSSDGLEFNGEWIELGRLMAIRES